jgi:hypothetical protein
MARSYELTADASRFLFVYATYPQGHPSPKEIFFVQNWCEELKQRSRALAPCDGSRRSSSDRPVAVVRRPVRCRHLRRRVGDQIVGVENIAAMWFSIYLQAKFAASSVLPLPLYTAACG